MWLPNVDMDDFAQSEKRLLPHFGRTCVCHQSLRRLEPQTFYSVLGLCLWITKVLPLEPRWNEFLAERISSYFSGANTAPCLLAH